MGTRHLIGVVKDGQWKIAQYGQWDGYPGAAGSTVLDFIGSADLTRFAKQVDKCRFGSGEEIKVIYAPFVSEGGWMNMDQAEAFKASPYGYLSRDTGAEILRFVYESPLDEVVLIDSHKFAANGLFCEWAYVIDFDQRTLEVYKGFHKTPVPEGQRFFDMVPANEDYSPLHLMKSYSLDDLPTLDTFHKDLEENEENEDEEDEVSS